MSDIDAALTKSTVKLPSQRQALFVASRDLVDLAAARAINRRIAESIPPRIPPSRIRPLKALHATATWVLNRLPKEWAPSFDMQADAWRTALGRTSTQSGIGPALTDRWFREALPLFEDPPMATAYATSGLAAYYKEHGDSGVQAIYDRVVKPGSSKAAS
jgi:hypothetical protein